MFAFEVHRIAEHLAEHAEAAVGLRVGSPLDDGAAPLGADRFALVIAKAGHQIAILDLEAGHNGEQPAVAPALRLDALQGVLQVRHGHGVHVLAEAALQLSQLVLACPAQ